MKNESYYILLLMVCTITLYHFRCQLKMIANNTILFTILHKQHLFMEVDFSKPMQHFNEIIFTTLNQLIQFYSSLFQSCIIDQKQYQIENMPRKNVRIHRKKNHSHYHCQTEHLSSFSMTEEQPFIDRTKQYLADLEQQQKTKIIKPSQTFAFDMSIQQWQSSVDSSAQVNIDSSRWRESSNLLPVKGQQNLISKSLYSEIKLSDEGSFSHQKKNKKELLLTKNSINRYRNGQHVQASIKFNRKPIQPVLFAMQTPSKPLRLNFGPLTIFKQPNIRNVTQNSSPKQQSNEKDEFFSSTNRFILRNRAITAKGFQLFRTNPQKRQANFSISQRKFQ